MRCVEWCRKLANLQEEDLEAAKIKNEYAQFLRIQVCHKFLHGPFVNPPPVSGKLCSLSECLGNLMANQVNTSPHIIFKNNLFLNKFQIPYLPRVGPLAPILHHKSPDGRAYVSAKQVPGGGVFCYMAVSPDGIKCKRT